MTTTVEAQGPVDVEVRSHDLLPCPFCGATPEIAHVLNMPPNDWQWYVMCCCDVNPASWDENQEKAIARWNMRSNDNVTGLAPTRGRKSDDI